MRARSRSLAFGLVTMIAAGAAPVAAQDYPGSTFGYVPPPHGLPAPMMGYGHVYPSVRQIAINQCASAAQARLEAYGPGRVLGISGADPLSDGRIVVRGVASSGRYDYAGPTVDLSWTCETDWRGLVRHVEVGAAASSYGNPFGYGGTANYDDFSRFGYRRY